MVCYVVLSGILHNFMACQLGLKIQWLCESTKQLALLVHTWDLNVKCTVQRKTLTVERSDEIWRINHVRKLWAKLQQIELGFHFMPVELNFCRIITSIHLVTRVKKWQTWHLSWLPSISLCWSLLFLVTDRFGCFSILVTSGYFSINYRLQLSGN